MVTPFSKTDLGSIISLGRPIPLSFNVIARTLLCGLLISMSALDAFAFIALSIRLSIMMEISIGLNCILKPFVFRVVFIDILLL
ncbi:hypothetical protein D9M70_538000 [compost metagenome]